MEQGLVSIMIDKFMLFMFGSSSLGGLIAQVTTNEPGTGTMSLQYLMLAAIGALGTAIVYLHRQNIKRADVDKADHEAIVKTLVDRLDKKESAMSEERVARIDMLMKRMAEDTEAKRDVAHAIANNTTAVKDLGKLLEDLERLIRKQNEEAD